MMKAAKRRMAWFVYRRPVLQIALLALIWLAGEWVVRVLRLPLPGGVIGLGLLLALLMTHAVRLRTVKRGSEQILGDMLLFFVPAVLVVLDHREFAGLLGLKLLFVITVSTILVMGSTALVVDRCCRWRAGLERIASAHH